MQVAQDCSCLACLQIVVEENPDVKSGYTIKFAFNENPFFSNSVLEKKVYYREDGTAEVTGVPPQWHLGKVSLPV